MPIAYAAHTESATFFLDDDGICRQIVRRAAAMKALGDDTINRCIGAQYVASLDFETRGGLVAMPQIGSPLLFAYINESGRIALVRTGALVKFEPKNAQRTTPPPPATPRRPAKPDSGVRQVPSAADELEIDLDDDVDDGARTLRFRADRDLAAIRHTPPPPAGRATPTPVHKVTIIPPPNGSSPTLPRVVKRSDGRGILPRR